MTVHGIAYEALRLLGHVNSKGAVDENREAKYFGVAPSFLNTIQREIFIAEGNDPADLTPLASKNDEFQTTAENAAQIAPVGLAAALAAFDGDANSYSVFSQQYYNNLLPSIRPAHVDVIDHYGVLCDPDMIRSD
jgi:hypothetical protein